jgi:protein PhnA
MPYNSTSSIHQVTQAISTNIMEEIIAKDSNGNILQEGDSVTVIKDLKVKGSSMVIKRGTLVKNIRLTDSNEEVEARVNKSAMVLRAEFLKKA